MNPLVHIQCLDFSNIIKLLTCWFLLIHYKLKRKKKNGTKISYHRTILILVRKKSNEK